MIYNPLMVARASIPRAHPEILSGVGAFPFSRRLLIQTGNISRAEQKISQLVDPLSHSLHESPAKTNILVTGAMLQRLKLFGVSYGAQISIRSQALQSYHVLIPLQGELTVRQAAQPLSVRPGEMFIYPPGTCLENSWSPGCVMFVVVIPKLEMEQLQYSRVSGTTTLSNETRKIDLGGASGKSFANLLSCLCAEYESQHEDDGYIPISTGLQELLLVALLRLLAPAATDSVDSRGSKRRREGVARAVDWIRANAQRAVSSAELAKIACLSTRSLQLGFHESFGIGPMSYGKFLRLSLARENFLKPGRQSIASIALQYGFANPGTFTRLYRQRYHEYPSTTLFRSTGPVRHEGDTRQAIASAETEDQKPHALGPDR